MYAYLLLSKIRPSACTYMCDAGLRIRSTNGRTETLLPLVIFSLLKALIGLYISVLEYIGR